MVGSSLLRGTSTVVRLASIAAVLFVLAGLIGFLTDEVKDSSKVSPARISQITGGAPAPGRSVGAAGDPYRGGGKKCKCEISFHGVKRGLVKSPSRLLCQMFCPDACVLRSFSNFGETFA